jgi:hypothetical protein
VPGLGAGPVLLENPSSPQLMHRPLVLHYLVDDTAAPVDCPLTPFAPAIEVATAAFALPLIRLPAPDPLHFCPEPNNNTTGQSSRLERPRNRPDYRLDLNAKQLTALFAAASLSPFISSAAILRHPVAPASRSALTNPRCDHTPPTPRVFTHGPPLLCHLIKHYPKL